VTSPTTEGLELNGVSVQRNGFTIVHDVSLRAARGEVTVVLGPNGAGRTTLVEAVSGVLPIQGGTMRLNNTAFERLPRVKRHRLGLAHVEQGRSIFSRLTVDENLSTGSRDGKTDKAYEWFPELAKRRNIGGSSLSGGEQQMLVIARALLGEPTLMMVDELSLGLAPIVVKRLMVIIRNLADAGVGILLVEQFAHLALEIGDRAYVMNRGSLVLEGSCAELRKNPEKLHQAYLL
jgi:branched-chain amino acid transport system ATP-binding protein